MKAVGSFLGARGLPESAVIGGPCSVIASAWTYQIRLSNIVRFIYNAIAKLPLKWCRESFQLIAWCSGCR